jgi:hypothetical protein
VWVAANELSEKANAAVVNSSIVAMIMIASVFSSLLLIFQVSFQPAQAGFVMLLDLKLRC